VNARRHAAGQGSLALVAALIDLRLVRSAVGRARATDYSARVQAQIEWESRVDFNFAFGIAPSWRSARAAIRPGTWASDYGRLLAASPDQAEVQALYRDAGLDIQRMSPHSMRARDQTDPVAAEYLARYITFDGNLRVPILSMHTTATGLSSRQRERLQASRDRRPATRRCCVRFHPPRRPLHVLEGETIAALQVLLRRLDTGSWDDAALQPPR